ncbi:MAG: DUF1353 domain-containing protein [Patescibacteria group bacterium]|nr:DUF1353 domain-containing protein [Patescibacteria group bacterium]
MKTGFQSDVMVVTTADGRNFTLLSPTDYLATDGTLYRIPVGATSDGASTPPALWPVLPPFGRYWRAAVLHDAAYRGTLERQVDGVWESANLPKAACDELLKEAMEGLGVDKAQVLEIYEGVHLGGGTAFAVDRKATQTSGSESV